MSKFSEFQDRLPSDRPKLCKDGKLRVPKFAPFADFLSDEEIESQTIKSTSPYIFA